MAVDAERGGVDTGQATEQGWPTLPTETEIYILPNGEIVVADLPAELAASIQSMINTRHQPTSVEDATTVPPLDATS